MNPMYSRGIRFLGFVTREVDVVTTSALFRRRLIKWSGGSRVFVDCFLEAVGGQRGVAISYRETIRPGLVLVCDGPPHYGVQPVLCFDHEVLLEVHGVDSLLFPVVCQQMMELRCRFQMIFSIG